VVSEEAPSGIQASTAPPSAKEAQQIAEEQSDEFVRDSHPAATAADPYGRLGAPLKHHSPFYLGFFGAIGALLAIFLGQALLSQLKRVSRDV
jgi:hypothetical protein